jgi:predicted Zn finger-like uncharacterized protein
MTILTACPHCSTQFNIEDKIALQHKGLVRCAKCNNVFNAIKNRISVTKSIDNIANLNNENISNPQYVEKKQEKKTAADIERLIEERIAQKQKENQQAQQNTVNLNADFTPAKTISDKIHALKILILSKLFSNKEELDPIKVLQGNSKLDNRLNKWGNNQRKGIYFKIGIGICLAILCAQIVYWQRGNISNAMPSTVPLFKLLCKGLACKVEPLKLKDNPVVSFSDMQKDMDISANRYLLNIGLQNKYPNEVAMPHLEISLFDLNEQLVTRSVFHPQNFLKPNDWKRLSVDGIKENEELPIKIKFETNQAISSFKVVVFYP